MVFLRETEKAAIFFVGEPSELSNSGNDENEIGDKGFRRAIKQPSEMKPDELRNTVDAPPINETRKQPNIPEPTKTPNYLITEEEENYSYDVSVSISP